MACCISHISPFARFAHRSAKANFVFSSAKFFFLKEEACLIFLFLFFQQNFLAHSRAKGPPGSQGDGNAHGWGGDPTPDHTSTRGQKMTKNGPTVGPKQGPRPMGWVGGGPPPRSHLHTWAKNDQKWSDGRPTTETETDGGSGKGPPPPITLARVGKN